MSETETNPQPGAAPQPLQVKQRILAQYVRDLSFENVLAQKGAEPNVQPEMQVVVSLDARKRAENTYEVITKVKVTSKARGAEAVLFLLELEYAGIFEITGLPEAQLHPYLLIECPRITFPFVRRIVSDLSRDGGFPPVNMEMIDFVALYRQQVSRQLAAQQPGAAVPEAAPTLNA